MSGVNAHAVFAPAPVQALRSAAPAWRHVRQRYWATPEPQHLLGPLRGANFGNSASFALDLCKPELAYLGDHQVPPCSSPTSCVWKHTAFCHAARHPR